MIKLSKSKLKEFKLIFFDFDGVIKESNQIKTEAFRKLFSKYGNKVATKVVEHHKKNTGISRFEKIPFYYERYLNIKVDDDQLMTINKELSKIVTSEVINSAWVKYSNEFLIKNAFNQEFFLITGTPQEEINEICKSLKIKHCFRSIHGSPIKKDKIVSEILLNRDEIRELSIFIGDSEVDYLAAAKNKISFVYRLGDNIIDDIKKKAEFYINDFRELV
tara:strand:- start:37 stop:693 length:657 start_codon:yes stop_codon:yes gene_type:complete